jgi:hypothetical protein
MAPLPLFHGSSGTSGTILSGTVSGTVSGTTKFLYISITYSLVVPEVPEVPEVYKVPLRLHC